MLSIATRGAWLFMLLFVCGCAAPARDIPQPDLDGVDPDVDAAVRAAVAEVRRDPESVGAWAALAERYRAQQWWVEAAAAYARAEELDPESFRWPYLRGHCLYRDDFEGAIEAWNRAIVLDGAYSPARIRLGMLLVAAGRLDEARVQLAEAARLAPDSAEVWIERGNLALSEGKYDDARQNYERALSVDAQASRARLGLSRALLALGHEDAAREQAELAASGRRAPRVPDPRVTLEVTPLGAWGLGIAARELMSEGRLDEAEQRARAAIELNPERASAQSRLGRLLMVQGRLDEAEVHLRQAVWLTPASSEAHSRLGQLLALRRDDPAGAVLHLETAARLAPDDAEAHYLLGLCLLDQGQLERARAELQQALSMAQAQGRDDLLPRIHRRLDQAGS